MSKSGKNEDVFTSGDMNALSGIEKFFINTVKSGALPQEPMNYDGAAMKAYISYLEAENERLGIENAKIDEYKCVIDDISKQCEELQSENAQLRARLENAVELPYKPDAIDVGLTKVVMSPCDESVRLDTAIYIYKKMPNIEEAEKFIEKHTGDQQ